MRLLRHLERIGRAFAQPILTLGNFDGVHRGHQAILRRLVERARAGGGEAVALTFHPHPAAVLQPARAPLLITDWRTRIELIAAAGVDAVIVQHFTPAFAQLEAEDFVRRLLVEGLGVQTVVVGHRVSFGHNRSGRADTLRALGRAYGFAVEVIGPVEVDGVAVSSSSVRQAVGSGDLDRAQALLGRPFGIAGRVVHGHHRGQRLGFPTANLRISGRVLPPDGVYAVRVRTRAGEFGGVANLGFNPTFQDREHSLEAHLFAFSGDLYGQRIEVRFVRRLRGEARFPSPQALAEQIARDVAAAHDALARTR